MTILQPSKLAKPGWLLLFLAIAAFYLWGLGSLPLLGPDEPLYSEVAREMFVRRDFVSTTLGGHPWFEKPSLLYWLMMAGYRVFGVSEYGARIGSALCGLLTAVFVYWIGRTIETSTSAVSELGLSDGEPEQGDLARWSTLVWLSSLGAMIFSRAASFDIVVTMALTGTLACFLVWHVRYRTPPSRGSERVSGAADPRPNPDQNRPNRWTSLLLIGFYFFIGVSLLAKGLIGIVFPFGIITTYFLLRRELPPRKFAQSLLWGIPLALAVAGLWYGPMIYRHGWNFINEFIIQHHFARYLSNKYHHPEAFYFYGPILIAFLIPWTLVFAAALVSALKWKWRGDAPVDLLRVFALAWILVPIAFFSFSGSKLAAYSLPVLPAMALLMGDQLTRFIRFERGNTVIRLTGLILISLGLIGGWYLFRGFPLRLACVAGAALPVVIVGTIAVVRPQIRRVVLVLIPLSMFLAAAVALKCAAPIITRPESVRDLLAAASARGYGATPVVQLHTLERTAEFYAADRMSYGSRGEPIKLEGAGPVIDVARRNSGVVLCFVPLEYLHQLESTPSIQTEVIGDNTRAALVVVRVR